MIGLAISWAWALLRRTPPVAWAFVAVVLVSGAWVLKLKAQNALCNRSLASEKAAVAKAKDDNAVLDASVKKLREAVSVQNRSIDALVERSNAAREEAAKALEAARKARESERGIVDRLRDAVASPKRTDATCQGDAGLERVWEEFK